MLPVTYFRDLLAHHPRDRHALLAYASALDFAGREADAAPAYEQAFAAGLDGDDMRQGRRSTPRPAPSKDDRGYLQIDMHPGTASTAGMSEVLDTMFVA